ncbi:MAG: hypothetical protein HYW14_02260 [Planctomycetes bacterium]|nr:hypothetical protein [Planctomycetota bacterium]
MIISRDFAYATLIPLDYLVTTFFSIGILYKDLRIFTESKETILWGYGIQSQARIDYKSTFPIILWFLGGVIVLVVVLFTSGTFFMNLSSTHGLQKLLKFVISETIMCASLYLFADLTTRLLVALFEEDIEKIIQQGLFPHPTEA